MTQANFLYFFLTHPGSFKLPLLLIGILLLNSCSTRKEIVYFQGIEELAGTEAPEDFQAIIEVNDVLKIDVSSLNSELVEPFQLDVISGGNSGGSENSNIGGYLVDPEGHINFPVLGKVKVIGLKRGELEEKLTEEIKEYVRDAVVKVRIINFKVTVLGEIGSNVIQVRDERLSVPQAIAMSGDITYDGKKDNILVIRKNDGKIEYGRLDLTSAEIFKNPYYYLKQNDILYVEPTYRKVKSAGFITSWQGLVSIVTTAFSLFILFNR